LRQATQRGPPRNLLVHVASANVAGIPVVNVDFDVLPNLKLPNDVEGLRELGAQVVHLDLKPAVKYRGDIGHSAVQDAVRECSSEMPSKMCINSDYDHRSQPTLLERTSVRPISWNAGCVEFFMRTQQKGSDLENTSLSKRLWHSMKIRKKDPALP
jgi:hypothetical protein